MLHPVFLLPSALLFEIFHWPTVLSVVPLVHCDVCLSVCRLWRFVLWQNSTS